MLGKEQAVPEHLIGPKELDFTIQPHDVSCTAIAVQLGKVARFGVVALWDISSDKSAENWYVKNAKL